MDDAGDIERIGLYGPFGWGNLGDAAIQEAMIHNVRRRRTGVEFVGISLNPDNTEAIHGIPAVPILRSWRSRRQVTSGGSATTGAVGPRPSSPRAALRRFPVLAPGLRRLKSRAQPGLEVMREIRFLRRAFGILRGLDALVISGGGQLSDDWGGPWDHPYSLYTWMLCARLAGARVYVVSVGAGPFRSRWSGRILGWALRLAHYRSYRDVESHSFLRTAGVTLPAAVYPDLAFSLPRPRPAEREPRNKPVVGISPLCYFYPVKGAWPEQNSERYQKYMAAMASFAAFVLGAEHPVVLFSNQIKNDRYAFDDLLGRLTATLPAEDGRLRAVPTRDLDHLLAQIDETDIVITSRLHGVILSYLSHKAVIALSYDPKIDAVMKHFGQSEYCLEIDRCTPGLLEERFRSLVSNLETVRSAIRRTMAENRDRLQEQYDLLFGRIRDERAKHESQADRVEA